MQRDKCVLSPDIEKRKEKKGHRYFLKDAIVKGCFFGEFLFIENIDIPFMIGKQKIPETGSRISFDFVIRVINFNISDKT
jgi:hypothetical protein